MHKDTADKEQRMAGKSENAPILLLQILLNLPDSYYYLSVISTMHTETQRSIVVSSAEQQIFNSL